MSTEIFNQKEISSLDATRNLAENLTVLLKPGDVVAFQGDLGAGKTTFIQFMCRALRVTDQVTSPTFTIVNEYNSGSKFPVYHFDFYRLKQHSELKALNFDDYLFGDGICLIEWAENVKPFLPDRFYCVKIWFGPKNERLIKIEKIQ